MFMWPHHMQQETRFLEEQTRCNHKWDVHHNWGLRRLDLDSDAFKASRFVVRSLQARMRDGTLVDFPSEGRLPFLDFNEVMQGRDEAVISLAVPRLQPHRANTARPATPGPAAKGEPAVDARFLSEVAAVEDENTGEDPQSLEFRTLNLKLLLDAREDAGYDLLPIARVERAGQAFQFDVHYIPPILACDAWKPLAVDILQFLFHRLNARRDSISDQVLSRGITFETQNPGDNVLLGQLAVLNEASTVLNTIAFAEGIHPFPAYLELCRLVGQLTIFSKVGRAPELPAYDHDDLGGCFGKVKRYLESLEPSKTAYEEREFIGEKLRMQVAMEAKWLEPAWRMFVGVQSPLPQANVVRLITKTGQLDMKIGSAGRVDEIFVKGQKGLDFTPEPHPPRMLPARGDLTYFQVNRDSQKSEWAEVQKSLTLAIRLNQNRIAVSAQGDIQGQRSLTIKQATGPTTTMQFVLFLVPGSAG